MVDVEVVMSLMSFVLLLWSENNETFGESRRKMSAEARAESPSSIRGDPRASWTFIGETAFDAGLL